MLGRPQSEIERNKITMFSGRNQLSQMRHILYLDYFHDFNFNWFVVAVRPAKTLQPVLIVIPHPEEIFRYYRAEPPPNPHRQPE